MYEDQLWELLRSDPAAQTAAQALIEAGGSVYIVGGAVRDVIAGSQPNDIDLMVGGLTDQEIQTALYGKGKLDYAGKQFGVYILTRGGSSVEIALPRTEVSTGRGHTEFDVTADPNIPVETDLQRRDFVSNAMAFDLGTNTLIDPYGGSQAITEGRLSLVNEKAFDEDPLRVVRALVAVAKQGLEPDEALLKSLDLYGSRIRHLPGERIQKEMDKLLSGGDPAKAIEIAFESGLIDYLLPELSSVVGFDQYNPHHDLDVGSHTLQVLRAMTTLSNDIDLRLAALFHDSGKPDSFWRDEDAPEGGGGHFYKEKLEDGTYIGQNHEEVGADLVRTAMERLAYPKVRINRVEKLVSLHMWKYFESAKGARRFLQQCEGDLKLAQDLLTIRQADAMGKKDGLMSDYDAKALAKARYFLQEIYEKSQAVTVKDLALNGHDLMALGLKGPEIGEAQRMLLEEVIEDPSVNTKQGLMNLLEGSRHPDHRSHVARKKKKRWRKQKNKGAPGKPYIPAPKKPKTEPTEVYQVPVMDQPKYKWSYGHDPEEIGSDNPLMMWAVDPMYGQPHHIEMTGGDFWKFSQGRIYIDEDGTLEILVWSDRASPSLQDEAIDAVTDWVHKYLDREVDKVTFQSEGINWGNLGRDPTTQEINNYYYGIGDVGTGMNDWWADDSKNWEPWDDSKDYAQEDSGDYSDEDPEGSFISLDDVADLEEYKQRLMEKPIHEMTMEDWEEYDKYSRMDDRI